MGSLPAALCASAMFRSPGARPLSRHETVAATTTAVATATMPVAAGFVGIVVALERNRGELGHDRDAFVGYGWGSLMAWAAGLAFLGVFLAAPLRELAIVREKLRFPSGTATAALIVAIDGGASAGLGGGGGADAGFGRKARALGFAAGTAGALVSLAYFVPIFQALPVLYPISAAAVTWGWNVAPALGYLGQGMIMGGRVAGSAMLGAVLSWGVVGPLV
eukprot:CAMPEP_0174896304 /NCGR_PEP_ID=MMETSP0167-20121228/10510_1 /TAXON_ID=38298 /ORGANISM="Rhodella maculata, Strain CCMP736" /LENGTH=219 /DNA_ID=CAMNT_0016135823 /DNA_START=11 /DNA_END=667 /DNA_ORIENTATION=-